MNVKALIKPVAVLAAVFVLLLALSAGLAPTAAENAAAEQARLFDTLLPGGAPFTEEAYNGEDTAIAAVHRGSTGYILETVTAGYAGDITCWWPWTLTVPWWVRWCGRWRRPSALGRKPCPTQAFSPSSSGAGASWP